MIALPRALAPWADLLGLFPPAVAADLGRWIPLLSLAVGPLRASRPGGDGEPDGFSGIARRGGYERLLLSECLLADELPDEFARRAVMGEHAFHELLRRTPMRARSSVALFDAGPDQLGSPRLAHLAALIVLAARAHRVGARFAWGILHQPEGALFPEVTAESVGSLVRARTALPPTAEDTAAWAARARQSGWEDAWLVGPAAGPSWGHGSLEIQDVLEPDRRALTVVARSPGAPERRAELELPAPDACVRLLRDPFSVAAQPARGTALAPVSNLVFGAGGTKLFARAASGEIIAYPVPNSPHDTAGHPRRYRSWKRDGVVAAVGWVKRALVMLTVTEDEIILEHVTRNGPPFLRRTVPRPLNTPIAIPRLTDPLTRLIFRESPVPQVFFLDAQRVLHRVVRDRISGLGDRGDPEADATGNAAVETIALDVTALAEPAGRIAFVGENPRDATRSGSEGFRAQPLPPGQLAWSTAGWSLVFLPESDMSGNAERLDDVSVDACFGCAEGPLGRHGLLAFHHLLDDAWILRDDTRDAPTRIRAPAGARVIGPWRSSATSDPELLVLDPDLRSIRFVGRRAERVLPRAQAPIADVVLSTDRSQLAYVTTAGEVVVHSLLIDVPLARFVPAEPEAAR